jgi:hypothetical protein
MHKVVYVLALVLAYVVATWWPGLVWVFIWLMFGLG